MVRGVPWTHSAIVRLIKDADEDGDGKLSFREVSVIVSIQYLHAIYTFYTYPFFLFVVKWFSIFYNLIFNYTFSIYAKKKNSSNQNYIVKHFF